MNNQDADRDSFAWPLSGTLNSEIQSKKNYIFLFTDGIIRDSQ